MKRRTIVQAISSVMGQQLSSPMTVQEVYESIVKQNLYTFHADNPLHIVRSQIRRHCKGLDFPSAHSEKVFEMVGAQAYRLLVPNERPKAVKPKNKVQRLAPNTRVVTSSPLAELRAAHERYTSDLKRQLLRRLQALEPTEFERFTKRFLEVYGFVDVRVTGKSRDEGIDGDGHLKAGLAQMRVAFQCKRWTKHNVGRELVSQFRGDIQGKYEQGIFLTTSDFTKDAQKLSIRPGAVPIVLLNGNEIVERMIEKGFGVETEYLPVHSPALDMILQDGD